MIWIKHYCWIIFALKLCLIVCVLILSNCYSRKKYTVVSKQKLCVHNNIYFATNTEHTGLNKSWQLFVSQLINIPYIHNLLTSSISLTTLTDLGRPGLLCRLSSTVPDSSNVVTILCTDFLLVFPETVPWKWRH
jgi:hypothetical protein